MQCKPNKIHDTASNKSDFGKSWFIGLGLRSDKPKVSETIGLTQLFLNLQTRLHGIYGLSFVGKSSLWTLSKVPWHSE